MAREHKLVMARLPSVATFGVLGLMAASCTAPHTQLTDELRTRSQEQGLTIAQASGPGKLAVTLFGEEGQSIVDLQQEITVRAIASNGKGVVGSRPGNQRSILLRADEVVVITAKGDIHYTFGLPESSGQPRFALSADLKNLVVCGRFWHDGSAQLGLQIFVQGKLGQFYRIDQLRHASRCGQLSWHPGGEIVAADVAGEIVLAHVSRNKLESWGSGSIPSWSPNGQLICYRPAAGGLAIASADKQNQKLLLTNTNVEGFSAWSPDGDYVAFAKGPDSFFSPGGTYVCRVVDGKVSLVTAFVPLVLMNPIVGWYYLEPSTISQLYLERKQARVQNP